MYDELIKWLRDSEHQIDCCICDRDCCYPDGKVHGKCIIIEAADAIEELSMKLHGDEAAISGMKREIERMVVADKPRWIPVTERLPEQGKRYLVIRFDEVTKTRFIDILWHDAHDLWWNRLYKGQYNVTHWMPLPQPPKEE